MVMSSRLILCGLHGRLPLPRYKPSLALDHCATLTLFSNLSTCHHPQAHTQIYLSIFARSSLKFDAGTTLMTTRCTYPSGKARYGTLFDRPGVIMRIQYCSCWSEDGGRSMAWMSDLGFHSCHRKITGIRRTRQLITRHRNCTQQEHEDLGQRWKFGRRVAHLQLVSHRDGRTL